MRWQFQTCTPRASFTLEAFSDSSWAGCKATRRSTSSGIIFLNGSFVMSVCRTRVSVALSSCEAELYAANGLMVESIYLYRLCKFLCSDGCESNSEKVQQRLFLDSSSALGLIRRTGTRQIETHSDQAVLLAESLKKWNLHGAQGQHQDQPWRLECQTIWRRKTQFSWNVDWPACTWG